MGLKKKLTTAIARQGVNYVRDVVESANCIFHEVSQQNDFGNDAFIELVENENVRGITIGAQIKSGSSYCSRDKCTIPATRRHFEYWRDHSLTIIGIVYDPTEGVAYWTNLKRYVRFNSGQIDTGPYSVTFPKKEFNRLTHQGFRDFFSPIFLGNPIILDYDRSKKFAESSDPDLHSIGIRSLMKGYCKSPETWEVFLKLFRERAIEDIDPILIYYLAHIPGHQDIAWEGGYFKKELRSQFGQLLKEFGRDEILRLLLLVDESGFERGGIGQSVDAVIYMAKEKLRYLLSIAGDSSLDKMVRQYAALLYACYEQKASINELDQLLRSEAETSEIRNYIEYLIKTLRSEGYVYLY
jgi:hypothetical protein